MLIHIGGGQNLILMYITPTQNMHYYEWQHYAVYHMRLDLAHIFKAIHTARPYYDLTIIRLTFCRI